MKQLSEVLPGDYVLTLNLNTLKFTDIHKVKEVTHERGALVQIQKKYYTGYIFPAYVVSYNEKFEKIKRCLIGSLFKGSLPLEDGLTIKSSYISANELTFIFNGYKFAKEFIDDKIKNYKHVLNENNYNELLEVLKKIDVDQHHNKNLNTKHYEIL